MIFEYCRKAIEKAEYKKLDDGTWYAEVPGFQGVWANAETVEDFRRELISVLEEWIVLKLRDGDMVPEVDGLSESLPLRGAELRSCGSAINSALNRAPS